MDNDKALDTAKLLATIGAICFVIGIVYNFGYFWEPGLNFFTFLSYKDHLTSLIFFALPCLVLAIIWIDLRKRSQKADVVACFWIFAVIMLHVEPPIGFFPTLHAVIFYFRGLSTVFLIGYLIAVIPFLIGEIVKPGSAAKLLHGVPQAQLFLLLAALGLIVFVFLLAKYQYHTWTQASLRWKSRSNRTPRPRALHSQRISSAQSMTAFS
jgi:hypothetical protein